MMGLYGAEIEKKTLSYNMSLLPGNQREAQKCNCWLEEPGHDRPPTELGYGEVWLL